MPLIDYRAVTIPRAFFLNALALGLSIALTAFVGDALRDSDSKLPVLPVQILVSSTCLYMTFWLLHWTFGYGGGQLAAAVPLNAD